MVLIEADRCFARIFARRGFFAIPEWVLFTMDISTPIEKIIRRNESSRNEFRKMAKYQYTYEVSKEKEKLNIFYHTMYLSHVSMRFGKLTVLETYRHFEDLMQKGELLLVKRGNEYVAGMLIYTKPSVPIVAYTGVKDGDLNLVRQGALSAAYFYTITWASGKGYTTLDFGHCRPILNDGVLLYKKKYGMNIQRSTRHFRTLYLSTGNCNQHLEEFFKNNPLIYSDREQLKGLLFIQKSDQPASREIDKLKKKYFIPGLKDFTIVSSNGNRIQTV